MYTKLFKPVLIWLLVGGVSGLAGTSNRQPASAIPFSWHMAASDAAILLSRSLLMSEDLGVNANPAVFEQQWKKAQCTLFAMQPKSDESVLLDESHRLGCEVTLIDGSIGWIIWSLGGEQVTHWGNHSSINGIQFAGVSAERIQLALENVKHLEADSQLLTKARLTNLNESVVAEEVALRVSDASNGFSGMGFRCRKSIGSSDSDEQSTKCVFLSYPEAH